MVVQETSSKDISYQLWRPFCSAEQGHLCNASRGHYQEHFCEIILNLEQWFRNCSIKYLLSTAQAVPLCSGVEPFECAILVAGIEKHFCEFIFYLHQCTKRCLAILIFSSGGHKVCANW